MTHRANSSDNIQIPVVKFSRLQKMEYLRDVQQISAPILLKPQQFE